jgi:hypothetical protein
LPAYEGRLPLQLNRFFGREEEIAGLRGLLLREAVRCQRSAISEDGTALTDSRQPIADSPRLVTLTGPGGSGKTRLALEVTAQVREAFRGAVWFVPLADLSDARQIEGAILAVLGLLRSPSAEPMAQVVKVLCQQPSLLLLDNFEHLVAEGASIVRTLLERVPSLDLSGDLPRAAGPGQGAGVSRGAAAGARCSGVRIDRRSFFTATPDPGAP